MRGAVASLVAALALGACASRQEPQAELALLPERTATCSAIGGDPALQVRNEGPGAVEIRWTADPPADADRVWTTLTKDASVLRGSSGEQVLVEVRSARELAVVRFTLKRGDRMEIGSVELRAE